jgi:hypothetical protein
MGHGYGALVHFLLARLLPLVPMWTVLQEAPLHVSGPVHIMWIRTLPDVTAPRYVAEHHSV